VLGKTCGLKTDEGTSDWSKQQDAELHDLYSTNTGRMRWAGHVAHTGERKGVCRILVGKMKERDHLEDRGLDGRIIFKWI
jgi:hypothetical protein